MSNFTFSSTDIPGVQIVDVKSFGDARGYFMETYKAADFAAAGITDAFVQDNQFLLAPRRAARAALSKAAPAGKARARDLGRDL